LIPCDMFARGPELRYGRRKEREEGGRREILEV
jgi:hypothetical protein